MTPRGISSEEARQFDVPFSLKTSRIRCAVPASLRAWQGCAAPLVKVDFQPLCLARIARPDENLRCERRAQNFRRIQYWKLLRQRYEHMQISRAPITAITRSAGGSGMVHCGDRLTDDQTLRRNAPKVKRFSVERPRSVRIA